MSEHQPAAATPPGADDAVRSGTPAEPLLDVRGLVKHFPIRTGFFQRITGWVKAVDGVDFAISAGETLGLVGESGCGKTTTGRCIMRAVRPTGGQVLFRDGRGRTVDVATAPADQLRLVRRDMQMIFQDPYSSLNPRMTVLNLVGEPLLENGIAKGKQLEERVRELLDLVGLNMRYLRRYPHAFSGGQRQRIGIARSLALNPRLIVADEPVSALDVSIQAQIINLLQDLQQRLDLTYLFVSHDLTVVEHISDRVAVMYVGNIVELTDTQRLFRTPRHPYTEALLSAVPKQNPRDLHEHTPLSGEVADPANAPSGCKFHPRCRYVQDVCRSEVPPLEEVEGGHLVACHFARELELQGFRRISRR